MSNLFSFFKKTGYGGIPDEFSGKFEKNAFPVFVSPLILHFAAPCVITYSKTSSVLLIFFFFII